MGNYGNFIGGKLNIKLDTVALIHRFSEGFKSIFNGVSTVKTSVSDIFVFKRPCPFSVCGEYQKQIKTDKCRNNGKKDIKYLHINRPRRDFQAQTP